MQSVVFQVLIQGVGHVDLHALDECVQAHHSEACASSGDLPASGHVDHRKVQVPYSLGALVVLPAACMLDGLEEMDLAVPAIAA